MVQINFAQHHKFSWVAEAAQQSKCANAFEDAHHMGKRCELIDSIPHWTDLSGTEKLDIKICSYDEDRRGVFCMPPLVQLHCFSILKIHSGLDDDQYP